MNVVEGSPECTLSWWCWALSVSRFASSYLACLLAFYALYARLPANDYRRCRRRPRRQLISLALRLLRSPLMIIIIRLLEVLLGVCVYVYVCSVCFAISQSTLPAILPASCKCVCQSLAFALSFSLTGRSMPSVGVCVCICIVSNAVSLR